MATLTYHWPLESDGSELIDSKDTIDDGTVVFGQSGPPGYSFGSALFDGTEGLELPSGVVCKAAPVSFTWWQYDETVDSTPWHFKNGTLNDPEGVTVYAVDATTYNVRASSTNGAGSGVNFTATGLPNCEDAWRFFALTCSSADAWNVYVDGALEFGPTTRNHENASTNVAGGQSMHIGARHGETITPFTGNLAQLKMWDDELSPAEVAAEYLVGLSAASGFDQQQLLL